MDSVVSEKRSARLRKSCETCRGSKAKCCLSNVNDVRCSRCIKEGKQCVFLEAKHRPKRAKNSRLRVAEMEEKLENLYALLSKNDSGTEVSKEYPPELSNASSDSPPEAQELTSTYPLYFDTTYEPVLQQAENAKNPPFSVFSHSLIPYMVFDNIQDVISKGMISFAEAEACLSLFQKRSSTFPFVVISPHTSLDSLRRERPFLLLSVLTFGSQHNIKLQSTLEDELREELSKRMIMNGEVSTDLLQGALVYLNWYHLYFKIDRQQIYQLAQISATMAVELYNDQNPHSGSKTKGLAIPNPRCYPSKGSDDIENKRTFLGAYYLNSAVCLCLRKPSILKHNDYVQDCSHALGQLEAAESDYLLPYFVSIQHLIEEMSHAFQCNVPQKLPLLDSARIEILYKDFQKRFRQMEMTFPPKVRNNPTIAVSFYSLKIHLTEVGFHARPPSPLELMPEYSSQSWYYSTARGETLIHCLQAAKDYLDFVLTLPNEAILNFCLPEFFRLVYAVLVLGVFTTGCDAPTIDAAYVRKSSNLLHYLDALEIRTTSMVTFTGTEENQDYMYHIRSIFQKSKSWYFQTRLQGYLQLDGENMRFMEILPSLLGKCADGSTISSKSTESSAVTEYSAGIMWSDMMSEFRPSVDPLFM